MPAVLPAPPAVFINHFLMALPTVLTCLFSTGVVPIVDNSDGDALCRRQDCCKEKLSNFYVLLSKQSFSSSRLQVLLRTAHTPSDATSAQARASRLHCCAAKDTLCGTTCVHVDGITGMGATACARAPQCK